MYYKLGIDAYTMEQNDLNMMAATSAKVNNPALVRF